MNRKGFTLIELLVVIGIIGILTAFLVPMLMGVQDRAKEAGVKSVMHSVQIAVESYNMENGSYPIASGISLFNLVDNYLKVGGYMITVPKNPFTGKAYEEADVAGKITYTCSADDNKYTLTAYKRDGSTKIQELTNM